MSQPHPTIPGVTVLEYTERDWFDSNRKRINVRARRLFFGDYGFSVYTNVRNRDLVVDAFPIKHAETAIAMIRDQASWLAEQNGGAE